MGDAAEVLLGFDRDPHPHIAGPREARSKATQPGCPLCEDLEVVPMGAAHHCEGLTDEILRDLFVEEVAHAVDEDPSRLAPAKGEPELIWMESDLKAIPVTRVPHGLQSPGEPLRIAVLAARADLGAPRDWVPG
jgi:hypothetical protein